MKKFFPYFLFSSSSLFVAILLSRLLGFSLSNTWQAGVVLALVFGPYWLYSWNCSNKYKLVRSFTFVVWRFCLILLLTAYIIALLVFTFVGW